MSRTSRRAAARMRMHLLLGATVTAVTVALIIFAVQWLAKGPDTPSEGSLSGNTDSHTQIRTSDWDGSAGSLSTDLTTDTTDSDENSSSGTDSATDSNTDSASGSSSAGTNSQSTATSGASNGNRPTDSNSNYKTDDPSPGVNDDGSFDFSAWNMILVNPDNPFPQNYPLKLTEISLNGKDRLVHSLCADAFKEMVLAAKKDGIILYLRSTYRGLQLQTDSFNAKVQEYINKGHSREEATKIAATIVAVPGTSEHHTGLAADITTPSFDRLNQGFENTDAFRWLYSHCAEYGFILRYPKDKTEITKIIYEPWHYRYVGKEAAQIIMREGICYEEFVEKYGNQ